ncbi:hypothetical protein Trydic_g5446 [Trypoxylus dichotomus]
MLPRLFWVRKVFTGILLPQPVENPPNDFRSPRDQAEISRTKFRDPLLQGKHHIYSTPKVAQLLELDKLLVKMEAS